VYYFLFVLNFKFSIKKLLPFFISWVTFMAIFFIMRHPVVAGTGATANVLGIIPFIKNNTVIPTIIAKFFVPFNLSTFPLYDNVSTIIGIILILPLAYLTFEYSKEKKWGVLMGLLWFLVFAVPPTIYRLENADVFFNYLEHRTYLPMIGIVIMLGFFLNDHLSSPLFTKRFLWIYIPVIIVFGILAWIHCADYKNNISIDERAANLNNPSALAGRARNNLERGDTTQALADIENAIELNPKDGGMYFEKGKLMAKMQNHTEAADAYTLALNLQPNLVDALIARSVEKRYLKQYESAFRDIYRAASIDPNNPKIYNSFGNLFITTKDYKNADSSYTKAITLNSNYAEAYNNRAYSRLFLQDYDGAIKDCYKALSIMKTKVSPIVLNNMGHAYRELNKMDSAFNYFNKAINMNKKFAEAYYERGKAFQKTNDMLKACNDWKNSLQYGYKDAQEMLDKYCGK